MIYNDQSHNSKLTTQNSQLYEKATDSNTNKHYNSKCYGTTKDNPDSRT